MDSQPTSNLARRPERFIGPASSLLFHALFLITAAWLTINPPIRAGAPGDGVDVGLALAGSAPPAGGAADSADHGLDAASSPLDSSLDASPILLDSLLLADADSSVAPSASGSGSLESLGGAGQGTGEGDDSGIGAGGGGGGGGTSFFGIASTGQRFLYIVDVSGSMAEENRIDTLRRELTRSIEALPVTASFFVVAYNDRAIPMGREFTWLRARDSKLFAAAWVREHVNPSGGTQPAPAFDIAFKFKPRPDVIYFMTDAQDIEQLPTYVAALNNFGRKSRVHAVAFGNSGNEELMRRLAAESGGKYRFVPSSGAGQESDQ